MTRRLSLLALLLVAALAIAVPAEAFTRYDLIARDDLTVGDDAAIGGDATIAGTLVVTGTITATGGLVGSEGVGTVAAGTEGSPGLQWTDDGDSGIRLTGANALSLVLGGSDVVDYITTGVAVTGTLGVSGATTLAGLLNADAGFAMDTSVFTIANTTGVISWVPTSTTQMAATFDGTAITTGTLLKMIGVDATMDTGGRYIEIFGGTNATVVWYVGESGATWIEPNVDTVSALWLDVVVQASGDALTIEMDDDINTTGLFIECLGGSGHDTSVFSVGEGGAVGVAGTLAAAGNVTVGGTAVITGATTVTGNLGCDGGFDMDGTVFVITNTTGDIDHVPTTTSGYSHTLDGTTITTGTMLQMIGVDATLTTGARYIEIFGGTNATVVWYVGEGGATWIEPNAATIVPLYLDCVLTTTADALTIEMDDDIQNGGLFIECLGGTAHDTSQFSVGEGGAVTAIGLVTAGTASVTGACALEGGLAMDTSVLTIANTTGVLVQTGTSTTQDNWTLDGTAITSGTILKMIAVDATMAAGYYIELFGGTNATVVWTVGESGAQRIEPNVNSVPALWLDCIVATSADALTIEMDDDIQNGGLFIECLGGAAHDTTQFNVAEAGVVYALGAITGTGGIHSGTGYAGTGATLSAAGAGEFDSTLTVAGAATLASLVCTAGATFGGGYGSSGMTITTAGVVTINGTITVDGASTLTGAVACGAALTVADTTVLTGSLRYSVMLTETVSAATDTIAAGNYGTTIFYTQAGAVAVTLPAAGEAAGSWFRCVNANSDTTAPTYATPVADNLIAFNNATADSVTFGSGHRIGSSVLFISNGSFWIAINENGSCTMTVTDA